MLTAHNIPYCERMPQGLKKIAARPAKKTFKPATKLKKGGLFESMLVVVLFLFVRLPFPHLMSARILKSKKAHILEARKPHEVIARFLTAHDDVDVVQGHQQEH